MMRAIEGMKRKPVSKSFRRPLKISKLAAPQVKKVPAGLAGVDGTFTISATLDDK